MEGLIARVDIQSYRPFIGDQSDFAATACLSSFWLTTSRKLRKEEVERNDNHELNRPRFHLFSCSFNSSFERYMSMLEGPTVSDVHGFSEPTILRVHGFPVAKL